MVRIPIYIPSFLGEGKKRPIRERCLKENLEWLLADPRTHITIMAQEWTEDDVKRFGTHERITLLRRERTPVGKCRNLMMRMFYASDDDFAFFADDDAYGVVKFDTMSFFDYFDKYILGQFDRWDAINFKKIHYISSEVRKGEYWSMWSPTCEFCTSLMIIKNFRKHNGIELYMDEHLPALEDFEFGMQMTRLGLRNYLIENPYCKEASHSIMFDDPADRKVRNGKARLQIARIFEKLGLSDLVKSDAEGGILRKAKLEDKYIKHTKRVIFKDEHGEQDVTLPLKDNRGDGWRQARNKETDAFGGMFS